jgi:hypothetical protein
LSSASAAASRAPSADAHGDAEAGATERLRLSRKQPKSWRQPRTIELRLTQDELPVAEITIRPRHDRIDADGAVALVRKQSKVTHRGKTAARAPGRSGSTRSSPARP